MFESEAAIIRNASISGELFGHWTKARYQGGISEGSGERGELRSRIAREAAIDAARRTGALSIDRMGMGRIAWAGTWQFDYAAAAARG